jgi:hypothetical protein
MNDAALAGASMSPCSATTSTKLRVRAHNVPNINPATPCVATT